jgi:tetratricopeptide (TPR) repeat protein
LVAGRLRLAAGPPPGSTGTSFEARREAFDWFESERSNIVAAVRTAYERGWHEMVWTFGEALWPAYDYHHHLDEAVEVFTMATEAARRCERDDAQARMQAQLARSLVERGDGEHAERLMIGAVELAQTTDNANLRASVTEWLGWLHLRAGRFAQAIDCLTESRRMCHALGSGRGVALQDYLLGKAYAAVGRPALARDHLVAAAAHPSLAHDDLMRARIRLALGIFHVGDDDVNEGLRILDGVIDAVGELGAVDLEVAALIAAADAEASVANGAAERDYLIRASVVLTDPDDPRAIRVVARLNRPPS